MKYWRSRKHTSQEWREDYFRLGNRMGYSCEVRDRGGEREREKGEID